MHHMTLLQEGPINTLALNRDCNKVVVTGRNIFRICEIKETGFVERDNIRTGKNSNLNFSCNDASWNLVDEQWLATAATNGAVVLWNIPKSMKLKQETVYYDHKRTVNKVTWSSDPNMLLSGSQDGTMKYFDIRVKVAVNTFVSYAESVRDVQFSPHQPNVFASVSENGTVQLWDVRRQDRCQNQFTAHSGPIFACDWHPEVKTWLATAGRDKAVKVWDLGFKNVLEYSVTTMASVGRIKWRPQRMYHIASCALVIDSSIHVWDVRRPYIPHASFNDHKDITTGIAWRGSPDVLLSTSKDSYLIQHVFADAERPTEKANPVCVAYNLTCGNLTLAATGKASTKSLKANSIRKTSTSRSEQMPSPSPSLQSPSFPSVAPPGSSSVTTSSSLAAAASIEDYPAVRCCVYVFESVAKPSAAQVFRECALRYQVTEAKTARHLSDICDHNANVAASLARHQVATVWRMVKLFFGSLPSSTTDQRPSDPGSLSLDAAPSTSSATTQGALGAATTGDSIIHGLLSKDHSSVSITAPIATASGTAAAAVAAASAGGGSGGGSSRHQSGNNSNVSSGGQDISVASTSNGGTITAGGGFSSAVLANNDRGGGGGFPSDTSGGVSEEADSEGELEEDRERTLSHIASGFSDFRQTDFLFGDVDADFHLSNGLHQHHHINQQQHNGGARMTISGGLSGGHRVASGPSSVFGIPPPPPPLQQQQQQQTDGSVDWILPSEAFQPRHEIKDRSPPPEHFTSRCFAESSRIETQMVEVEDSTSALLCLPGTHSIVPWNGTLNLIQMIEHLAAEEGDVQTAVTLVLVLGDRIRHLLNDSAVEHWFFSYIDVLSRCRLWNAAALVVKLCQCDGVQQRLSHRSTIPVHCGSCLRSLQRPYWHCDGCKAVTNTCSLCHLAVRGLYVWCRGCSHGGHLLHMREWFSRNAACPTGCGHLCEYD